MTDDGEPSIRVALSFFSQTLPQARDLASLKATLHVVYLAARQSTPGVSLAALHDPAILESVVGLSSPEPAETRMIRALGAAVADGSLLRMTVTVSGSAVPYFLPATDRNRGLLHELRRSNPRALRDLGIPEGADVVIYRPNIFALYEQHIGPLTPLLAEQLRHAERAYPRDWIEDAILTAVQYDRRSWRYVEAILARWETDGAPRGGV